MYILNIIQLISMAIYKAIKENLEFKTSTEIILGVFRILSISFFEESLFRGLITNAFAKKHIDEKDEENGILKIIIYTSLIYGISHIINIFTPGINIPCAIIQILNAILIGAIFTAIYLRGGSILVTIILNMITNIYGLYKLYFFNIENIKSEIDLINSRDLIRDIRICVMLFGITILYVSFLIRKSKINDIKNTIKIINT